MSAQTSRLKLTKPGGGSHGTITPGDPVDIDVLNDNADILDGAVGAQSFTSTTRPATPFIGQLIRETDTQRLKLYNGTTWVNADDVGSSRVFYNTSQVDSTTAGAVALVTAAINPTVGHTYEIVASVYGTIVTAAVTPQFVVRHSPVAAGPGSTDNAIIQGTTSYAVGTGVGSSVTYYVTAISASPIYYLIYSTNQSGTGALRSAVGQLQIKVTDLGVAS